MKVVICGGGIIGVSTAYFLATKGVDSIIIEENAIACGASGNAGGFLARKWCDHNELGVLARFSFDIHMKLSTQLENCDYRTLDTLEVNVVQNGKKTAKSLPQWIDGNVTKFQSIGTQADTAQVHPKKLCEALLNAARGAASVIVKNARVIGFAYDDDHETPRVNGVKIRFPSGEEVVELGDAVVVAMGPWSSEALRWLGRAPVVSGSRAHGIVLRPKEGAAITPHALFVESKGQGLTLSSETINIERHIDWNRTYNADVQVYPRPDNTIYMCGMSDKEALPPCVGAVQVSEEIVTKMKAIGDAVSSAIAEASIERKQSCYIPISMDYLPMIGKIDDIFIGTGHGCWGILNGPGTGLILADLIVDGRFNMFDITPFEPVRLVG